MGAEGSKPRKNSHVKSHHFKNPSTNKAKIGKYERIGDNYRTFDELTADMRRKGLESSNLIFGIDFTKSNTWQGGPPYHYDNNLHSIGTTPNPYQKVIQVMCRALVDFDDDGWIPVYGFGDSTTTDKAVFPIQLSPSKEHDGACLRMEGVLEAYNSVLHEIASGYTKMSGPTSFAPIIKKAIDIVKQEKSYHILVIICDGGVDHPDETVKAIVEASNYPLSIVIIGVGKGPWDKMELFDDMIGKRRFDNVQFVNFHKIMKRCENEEVCFAHHALMEIPLQYEYIKKHYLR